MVNSFLYPVPNNLITRAVMSNNADKSIEQWLWDAACSIRDAKDAPKYKDYILPLVFAKRLCDVYDDEINRIAQEVGGAPLIPLCSIRRWYVKRSTGFADGLAWVRSTDDFAYTLGDINLGSHLPHYNTRTRGYVPFNSLPALPEQCAGASDLGVFGC